MESDEFWQIIEQASKQVGFPRLGDCDAETYLDALYDKIVLLTPREIVSMEMHNQNIWFAYINTDKIWAAHQIVTDNQWLEFRASLGEFLMGFGREKFHRFVCEPDSLLESLTLGDIREGIYRSHSVGVSIERAWKTVTGLDDFIRLECDVHIPIHPEGIEDRLAELCPKLHQAATCEKAQNNAT